MSNTLTVRLPDDLLNRLKEKSRRTGLPLGRVVRESLESTLNNEIEPIWMKYAGTVNGPRNLSSRKGYSRS
jgi:predicted DNA-binding protein